MKVLILSCSTGGGHNSAGRAMKESMERRGHTVIMMDPYELKSNTLAKMIGNIYVRTVQAAPKVFGEAYRIGNAVRKIPGKSPVYAANIIMAKRLYAFMKEEKFDAVLMPHLFPAEIITYMKRHNMSVPITVFVATDYTCIPFTEETECDYYVIPSEEMIQEFMNWGIPKEKLLPLGIPVRKEFYAGRSKEECRIRLGLEPDKKYAVISGGSMGAGDMEGLITAIADYLKDRNEWNLIVICGSNDNLFQKLSRMYQDHAQVHLIGYTGQMADYMEAADAFMTKPGGLSTTEAAAVGVSLVHLSPIPGCEEKNMEYFKSRNMSLAIIKKEDIPEVFDKLEDEIICQEMKARQRKLINAQAAEDICKWLENSVELPLP